MKLQLHFEDIFKIDNCHKSEYLKLINRYIKVHKII